MLGVKDTVQICVSTQQWLEPYPTGFCHDFRHFNHGNFNQLSYSPLQWIRSHASQRIGEKTRQAQLLSWTQKHTYHTCLVACLGHFQGPGQKLWNPVRLWNMIVACGFDWRYCKKTKMSSSCLSSFLIQMPILGYPMLSPISCTNPCAALESEQQPCVFPGLEDRIPQGFLQNQQRSCKTPLHHHWITKKSPLSPQFDVDSLRSSTVGGTSPVLGGAWRARRKAGGLERENGGLLRAICGSTHAERFASYNQETLMSLHTAVAQKAWPTNSYGSSSSPPGEHIPVLLFVVSNSQTPSMKFVRHGKII